jgi:hypothetical protein
MLYLLELISLIACEIINSFTLIYSVTGPYNNMRINEILQESKDKPVQEAPASRALCTSGKPDSALGASNLASCKSQGYRSREGGKSHKVGSDRVKVRGKKIRGKKYGGPLPDWS